MGNGLEVGRTVSTFNEESLIEFQAVGRARHRIVKPVGVVILHHLAGALFEVGRRHDPEIGIERQPDFLDFSGGRLHHQTKNRISVRRNQVRQCDFGFVAIPIFGNDTANGFVAAPVTSRSGENGGDVLGKGANAQRLCQLFAQPQAFTRRIGFREKQSDHPLRSQGAGAKRSYNAAVDAAGNGNDRPFSLALAQHGFPHGSRDALGFGYRIKMQNVLGNEQGSSHLNVLRLVTNLGKLSVNSEKTSSLHFR